MLIKNSRYRPIFIKSILNRSLFSLVLLSSLNSNGQSLSLYLDNNFLTNPGFNGGVNSIGIQNDGKIIVAGGFISYNGSSINRIIRLFENGIRDNSFQVGIGFNNLVYCTAIQPDGKIIVGGNFSSFNGVSRNFIARLNTNGSLDQFFLPVVNGIVQKISIQSDGKIILVGNFTTCNSTSSNYIARLNINGTNDLTFNIGSGCSNVLKTVAIQSDGKILIGGSFTTFNGVSRNCIARLNSNGSVDPNFNTGGFGNGFNGSPNDIILQTDGKIIVGGIFTSFNGVSRNKIARLNNDGTLDASFDPGLGIQTGSISSMDLQVDGKLIIGGLFYDYNGDNIFALARINSNGTRDLAFNPGTSVNPSYVFFLKIQDNGKILIGGNWTTFNGQINSSIARLVQPAVAGLIFKDFNGNCTKETNEIGFGNYQVNVNPGNLVATSNSNGYWWIDSLNSGNYTVTLDTTNINWTPSCMYSYNFTVINSNVGLVTPNFGLISNNPCTDPDVSIYAPFLRRCLSNQQVYVTACNQTTATGALNASYVDVELNSFMTVTASSLPYTAQGNNIYRFQTGNLNPGQCASFNITTTISCNAVLGQTLCMDANLYPVQLCALDTIPSNPPSGGSGTGGTLDGLPQPCTLPWDQSSLSVDGWCQNDSIYFTVTNTGVLGGGDMECYAPVWLNVNGVVTFTDSILLQGGQTITYAFLGNGQTWILNASQHPLHPGNSQPNAFVERCGDTLSWTPGDVNDFPQDDADPIVDIYCGVVTGSYDPNDKTGFPIGQTDQFYIQPNQQLQYAIRFQNTGTDTAFTVVIRDTLDIDLNIFTVTPGVSSHNYEFRMYGPRVLEWTFNNINLPDSAANQAGSNGFVTFHVEQVPDLAPGTEISNDADIYFDFNAPITTNTTMHRIFEGFVSVLNLQDLSKGKKQFILYPNPTSSEITITSEKFSIEAYTLCDQMGRVVGSGKLTGTNTTISLSSLSKGIYLLKVAGDYEAAMVVKE